jgi:hypothetical protein
LTVLWRSGLDPAHGGDVVLMVLLAGPLLFDIVKRVLTYSLRPGARRRLSVREHGPAFVL